MELYVPILVLAVLAAGFAIFSVADRRPSPAPSAGTAPSSRPTSAASSRRRSRRRRPVPGEVLT